MRVVVYRVPVGVAGVIPTHWDLLKDSESKEKLSHLG